MRGEAIILTRKVGELRYTDAGGPYSLAKVNKMILDGEIIINGESFAHRVGSPEYRSVWLPQMPGVGEINGHKFQGKTCSRCGRVLDSSTLAKLCDEKITNDIGRGLVYIEHVGKHTHYGPFTPDELNRRFIAGEFPPANWRIIRTESGTKRVEWDGLDLENWRRGQVKVVGVRNGSVTNRWEDTATFEGLEAVRKVFPGLDIVNHGGLFMKPHVEDGGILVLWAKGLPFEYAVD